MAQSTTTPGIPPSPKHASITQPSYNGHFADGYESMKLSRMSTKTRKIVAPPAWVAPVQSMPLLAFALAASLLLSPSPSQADFGRTGGAVQTTGLDGYLRSLLAQLKVPLESQVLVFSQTSLQRRKISPTQPRAFYFNDDVYIGWVQRGTVLEILSMDPIHGGIFFTLEQRKVPKPTIVADDANCLACHQNGRTLGVPGPVVRSVYADKRGRPVLTMGTFDPDHTTPLEKRWGGYYVTGKHGSMRHMGNICVTDPTVETFDRSIGANVTSLKKHFDVSRYLTEHSDIVSMLVLDHQVYTHNVLTRANFEGRSAMQYQKMMAKMLEEPQDKLLDSVERRFDNAANAIVEALLFADEAQLTSPIRGASGFKAAFEAIGPKDSQGRSLRQFDLEKRLFKYPCSFLIDNPAFNSLPKPILDRTYKKLHNILTNADQPEPQDPQDKKVQQARRDKFKHLTKTDRQAILEILLATKKNLPDYWRK